MIEWKWYGHALHFICSYDCQFHLATELPNGYLVSTVGDYFPRHKYGGNDPLLKPDTGEEVGYSRKYETMVFRVTGRHECGCPDVDHRELMCEGYKDHNSATVGHLKVCVEWAMKPRVTEGE